MKSEFVNTSNNKRFRASVFAAEARGSREACLMTVTGRPGEGKTHTLLNWAGEVKAVIITGQVDWTTPRMMRDLAEKLQIEPTGDFGRKIGAFIGHNKISIIVDEAGFALANNAACLDKLRGITDATKTLLVLVFMPRDVTRLEATRFGMLNDRISERCQFQESTLADVELACNQLSDVAIAPDLAAHICGITDARMRLVLNAIARVEGEASMRPADQRHTPMTMNSIKDLDLFKGLGRVGRGVGA